MQIEMHQSPDGSGYYWQLKAGNKKVIAISVKTNMRWDKCLATATSVSVDLNIPLKFDKSCRLVLRRFR